jgi:hypothetical protein
MDRGAIVAYRDRKRLSARAIHKDIVARLGPIIMGYRIVARSLREAKFPNLTGEPSDADDRKPFDDADEAILSVLNESPFASLRQLWRLTQLPPATVA